MTTDDSGQTPEGEVIATALTPAAGTVLEPDDDSNERDSAYNDSVGSESYITSLKSSIMNYKYENGRRYHAFREGEYLVPNDEQEQDRMDLLHHVYAMILGGELHLAPLKEPQRVLDIGTGTGIWAIDFADQYPSATVIGNDLSPIQPAWVPPNVQFEVDDFEAEWTYSQAFDYIHGRELGGSIRALDQLAKRALSHLKPGGWFELQAFRPQMYSDDNSHVKATQTIQFANLLQEGSAKFGKPMTDMDTWVDRFSDAGFADVTFKCIKVPMAPWPKDPKQKEIGRYFQAQFVETVRSYLPALLSRVLGWSKEEITVLSANVIKESKDPSLHHYGKLYIIYGKKPSS